MTTYTLKLLHIPTESVLTWPVNSMEEALEISKDFIDNETDATLVRNSDQAITPLYPEVMQ